jgi:hypothetical protein
MVVDAIGHILPQFGLQVVPTSKATGESQGRHMAPEEEGDPIPLREYVERRFPRTLRCLVCA